MEIYKLDEDRKVLCLTVDEFPRGIQEAFNTLGERLSLNRNFYGISYLDEAGQIVYKAAAEQLPGEEAGQYGYEPFTITKGEYLAETIRDWMKNLPAIGDTFMTMMKDPRMDKTFPCVEWYQSDAEMLCMVRMLS